MLIYLLLKILNLMDQEFFICNLVGCIYTHFVFVNMYFLYFKCKINIISMDGSGEHYAKWNKPGSERQIPYDVTYKWNLIKKAKQAKYNQRHWNKEQTDSNQRGGGRGIRGKGHQGTCIKDPWTKPKWGRIEGGGSGEWGRGKWWRENGENCTWTMKKKINKYIYDYLPWLRRHLRGSHYFLEQ